jgi:hypothetical protein
VRREAARQALERVAARHRQAEVLTAAYRQERSSALLVRPLVSTGRLALRRDPPCLMFHTAGEGGTVIRLTRTMYEVHRPAQKTLERTPMAAPTLPDALFQAFRPDPEVLGKRFRITALEEGEGEGAGVGGKPRADGKGGEDGKPGEVGKEGEDGADGKPGAGEMAVHLVPLEAATARFVRELVVTLAKESGQLRAIAYLDGQGDRVRLVLSDLQRDPEGAVPRFVLDVPAGTKVLVHEPVGKGKEEERRKEEPPRRR